ncbi:hypothetical protein ONE63_010810 [Megalurothrips usitatus]|uniref:Protein Wnt n=1 Tax=Megalurothrips usitatus TaxID=439358 RepID=A0AAV7XHW7_9NEOP|nr:hypothetical protein ONE63_010810 [Megalurothrips usitatus]
MPGGRLSPLSSLAYEEAGLAGALLCRTLPGLSRDQQALCRRQPDATWTALQGLRAAAAECQQQFRSQRWNCSALTPRGLAGLAGNPQGAALLRAGFRESAFAHAISAAGITHAISRACARGQLLDCGCDHSEVSDTGRLSWVGDPGLGAAPDGKAFPAARWKWSGCSHNVYFGSDFAKVFLDGRRPATDIQARVSQHNNRAGRLAVKTNMQVRCKCHGVSGSCELRTCWRAAPDFRVVGAALKERFQGAVLVDQSNLGGGHPLPMRDNGRGRNANRRPPSAPLPDDDDEDGDVHSNRPYRQRAKRRPRPRRRPARDLSQDLLYLQRSPNFCDADATVGFPGTAGRRCQREPRPGAGVDQAESCDSLCCGRGYNLVRANHTRRCQCSFLWCCQVKCETCTVDEWVAVCK